MGLNLEAIRFGQFFFGTTRPSKALPTTQSICLREHKQPSARGSRVEGTTQEEEAAMVFAWPLPFVLWPEFCVASRFLSVRPRGPNFTGNSLLSCYEGPSQKT